MKREPRSAMSAEVSGKVETHRSGAGGGAVVVREENEVSFCYFIVE